MTNLLDGQSPSYTLIHDPEGHPLASLHEGPGPDRWWWATLIPSFKVLGPYDSREHAETMARRIGGAA